VLVDDMYERNADDILAKLKTVTDKPVKYVLNTHQHEDHAGGNTKMAPIAEIIAHRNVRANLLRLKQPWLPRVTFSEEAQVFLGGKEVRASYFGRGHTGGDAVIYFPEVRTIHTGDLFLSGPVIPRGPGGANIFVDYAEGGSFVEWTKVLDETLKLDFDTVIPGHGPVATRAELVKFRGDFEGMRNRVRDLLRQNKGKAEVSSALVNEYGWPAGGLAIAQVDAVIAELNANAR
jgi:glyoxylase-like metal-dependent hydrolase (beta-lactamase superfamily II)